MSSGFNPCFDGMRELNDDAERLIAILKECFNPCFDGMRELNCGGFGKTDNVERFQSLF